MELREIGGLDDANGLIIELVEVEHRPAFSFALFLQELVETAFDVVLDRAHGAGSVQNDDEVCVVVFHVRFLVI